jgi:hypothetical protein
MQVFGQTEKQMKWLPVRPDDAYALVKFKNGTTRRYELYYGASFLSQSVRQLPLSSQVVEVQITNFKGHKRKISLPQAYRL